MKRNVSVSCGDWHLGWGYGGKDKIGTLTKTEDEVYVWEGHSQGRHGSKWNLKASCYFTMADNKPRFLEVNGDIPRVSELFKSVLELELELDKKPRVVVKKQPSKNKVNLQLKLF